MMNRDVDTAWLCSVYASAFNTCEGNTAEKHVAGLLAVVCATQPHRIYPRTPKPPVKT